MLLKRYVDYRVRLGLGQLWGTLGLIGLIASGAFGNTNVLGLFMEESRLLDFLRGFLTGLSAVALGMSVVFSAAALVAIRRERNHT
jgi:hypothetical protein